jgi:hypothetical protein
MLRPVQKLLHRDRILFYGLTFNINPKLIHKSVLYDFVAFCVDNDTMLYAMEILS